MNNSFRTMEVVVTVALSIMLACIGFLSGRLYTEYKYSTEPPQIESTQWGGNLPMKVYTIYDKDTGVYYAVTEKGGICVMETMNGETKLVDEGEGQIIHKNQGR